MTDPNQTILAPAFPLHLAGVAMASSSDIAILALGVILATIYLFRDQILVASKSQAAPISNAKVGNGVANPRDFVEKMKHGVRTLTKQISLCITNII